MKNEGSFKGLKTKIKEIFPFEKSDHSYLVFSAFLVLPLISFISHQFPKRIPVLKSSEPQLSDGSIYFSLYVNFYLCYEAFYFFLRFHSSHFCCLDKNFKTFIAHLIFGQIQLPGAVLNAELLQLSKTFLGFKIWWIFDGEITVWTWSAE